jgi:hypothetical protein
MDISAATLPIDHENGLRMDAAEARSLGQLLHPDYAAAAPFPHIVIDGILPDVLARRVVERFPAAPLPSDTHFEIGYAGQHKRQILPEDCTPDMRELFHFFNSRPVLQFLEGLTGIEALLPDPYFSGGGFHEISAGGLLGIHADFRINEQLHLQRRLNMLIYLNPDWQDEWGGRLELWDRGMQRCERSVAPLLNRCVVFNTDSDTYHGHPDPLACPPHVKRRSIALYYYTASRAIYREVPKLSTMYQARPNDAAEVQSEARRMRGREYLHDWAPPIAVRAIDKAVRAVGKVRSRLGGG